MSEGTGGEESLKGAFSGCLEWNRPEPCVCIAIVRAAHLGPILCCSYTSGSVGTEDEAAAAYEFLLHPRNSCITGQTLNVNGGLGSIRVATSGNPEAPRSHE